MGIGPGKYDDACTAAREATGGEAVVLIVLNGKHGAGFSVQSVSRDISAALPDLLEHTAQLIREDMRGAGH
jgi:hypothetical protein